MKNSKERIEQLKDLYPDILSITIISEGYIRLISLDYLDGRPQESVFFTSSDNGTSAFELMEDYITKYLLKIGK